MIVSYNNSTTADHMNWIRRYKIRFIFFEPFIEFNILTFCMMKLKPWEIYKLMDKVKVGVGEMNPNRSGLILIIFFQKIWHIILKGSVFDDLLGSDMDCFVTISSDMNILLSINELTEKGFIDDSSEHPKFFKYYNFSKYHQVE